jgi:subtilisin family serine protease
LTLQFASLQDIPQVNYDSVKLIYKINCKDLQINNLLKELEITAYSQKYPSAKQIKHPKAEGLDRIYNLQIKGDVNGLYLDLIKLKSVSLSNFYLADSAKTLIVPNDYSYSFDFCGVSVSSSAELNLINAPLAWNITQGNPNIVIGVVDIGFDNTNSDLVNKLLPSPPYSGTYSNNAGYHGTRVAGIAGSETNNNIGLASIGNKSSIKFFDWTYNGILTAISEITPNKCKVINCSFLSGCSYVQDEQNVIDIAFDSGIVVIAAAGNSVRGTHCGIEGNGYVYPASYSHVVSVTSVGSRHERNAYYSCRPIADQIGYSWKDVHEAFPNHQPPTYNSPPLSNYTLTHNDRVDLCAPGQGVVTIGPNNTYFLDSWGTSFATPMVAGTAALILSVNSNLTPDDVKLILKCSTRDVYEVPENILYLNLLGSGRLDAGKAVQLAQTWVPGSAITQQISPTDIRWFEILSNGVNTIEVESTCGANNNPEYCNIGYRLQVISSNPNLTFKWLTFYSENIVGINPYILTNNIQYGNSIYLSRGVDYPYINNVLGSIKACVRVNECVPSIYYAEDRASTCLGDGCMYNCPADIYITGNYSTPLKESYTWVKSTAQTTISPTTSVKLDGSPTQGYVEFKPTTGAEYLLAEPSETGEFIVQAYNGCDAGAPSLTHTSTINEAVIDEQITADKLTVYPNPTNGLFYVECKNPISSIQVYNTQGVLVLEKQMSNVKKVAQKIAIDLSNFSSGVYILRSKGENFNYKIVKL